MVLGEEIRSIDREEIMSKLPFTPPFKVVHDYPSGDDAYIIDSAGNIPIEVSQWVDDDFARHHEAMILICNALNKEFPTITEDEH
jgi:hypothetical protein